MKFIAFFQMCTVSWGVQEALTILVFQLQFHEAGDTLEVGNWAPWFAEDVTVKMGNNPAIHGRENLMKVHKSAAYRVQVLSI